MQKTDDTQLNLVIGYPLEHSQSPLLHNTVYQHLKLNSFMRAQSHASLNVLIQEIKMQSIKLTAVTMPFKEKVFHYLNDCSEDATALKTVNTLIQQDDQLHGYNTDIAGIAFTFLNIELCNKHVLVMGAGGAARAMGYFLKKNNANIIWMNRNSKKAEILAKEFGGSVIISDKINQISPDIIVNATPVGLYPHVNGLLLPDYIFNKNQIVFDMVYNPVLTKLLKQAQKHQAQILSGLDMFIGQGLKQIELLTSKKLEDAMLVNKLKKLLIEKQQVEYV